VLLGRTVVVVLMVACTTSAQPPPGPSPTIPRCAAGGSVIPPPPELPEDLPLPSGTVFTSMHVDVGTIVLSGVVPLDLRGAATFFIEELPAAGYELGEGDAEQGEAESVFAGHGYRGRWRVNGILDCPNAVTLTLAIVPP
jgi:hypothetical protein